MAYDSDERRLLNGYVDGELPEAWARAFEQRLAGQHGVCLPGHRGSRLERRHELPREPGRPVLRHVEPDG